MRRLILSALLVVLAAGTAQAGSQQTGSTNSTGLLTRVRYVLDEPTAAFWSDAELLSWLNNGVEDIAARTKCLQASENATLRSGVVEYFVSSSYVGLTGALYYNGSSYKALDRANPFDPSKGIGNAQNVGEPVHYADWGGKVLLWPEPGSAVDGKTVSVFYVERPSRIASGDAVPVPAYLVNALEMYVASQALYKDRQDARAAWYESKYKAEIDRYRSDYVEFSKEPAQ
jgi:hypothetical protein